MSEQLEQPQIYLVTPKHIDLEDFTPKLSMILDRHEIACVRIALTSNDEKELGKAADALRSICHERDVAIVIDSHVALAQRHGLDGVHLLDGARSTRKARETLGADAIIGCYCENSRHDGLNAGEIGADYISFGPVGENALGTSDRAEKELFEWWTAMIEVPIVAEGLLSPEAIKTFAPHTDFFAIGEEIWNEEDPIEALDQLIKAMEL